MTGTVLGWPEGLHSSFRPPETPSGLRELDGTGRVGKGNTGVMTVGYPVDTHS